MSENHPAQHPLPAGVHDTFTYSCNSCGGTVSVIASTRQPHDCGESEISPREVLDGIKAQLAAANPLGAEWAPLTDPGDRNRAPAWIVDADDLEIRMDATYAAGKVAAFVAAAPATVTRLAAALEAVLAYGTDREEYTDTGDPKVDMAIRSYAYHIKRVITQALAEP